MAGYLTRKEIVAASRRFQRTPLEAWTCAVCKTIRYGPGVKLDGQLHCSVCAVKWARQKPQAA